MIGEGGLELLRAGQWASLMFLAAGCTILAPVQTPESDRRFPLRFETSEPVPCVDDKGSGTQCKADLKDSIDSFHGGLGRALWETDIRRRQLVAQAAEHTNINSAYNALLWPLGAYFIAKKIRKPEWRTLDTAAVATATYGFLGSGIPERDQLYLKTSARMACTIVEFDAELYPSAEVAERPPGAEVTPAQWSLAERLDVLALRVDNFRLRRDVLITEIELEKPRSGVSGKTAAERARLNAMGLSSTPKAVRDPTDDLFFETDKALAAAEQQLIDGNKLKVRLDRSGDRLRQQRIRIEGALTQGLNDRTPALQSPLERGREIAQAFEQGMTAERKFIDRVKKESGTARAEGWQPTAAQLQGLTSTSRKSVVDFWKHERASLKTAQAQLGVWTSRHDERVRQAKADASAMGCNDGSLADFTSSLLKKVSDAAATPSAAGKASEPAK